MNSKLFGPALAGGIYLALTALALGQSPPAAPATRPAGLTVAVLPFATASGDADAQLGGQMAELLTISLSGRPGLVLVERAALAKVLEEQALNLSGLVEPEQAVKIGRLVGARILVTGKTFASGNQTMLTAKLIGTETTRVEGVLVQADGQADLPGLTLKLAEEIAQRLATIGPQLVGETASPADPLPRLQAALRERHLPVVAVIIPERHMASAPPVPDPAVETELKRLLIACGFRVQDVRDNELTDFVRRLPELSPESWPRALAGAEVVIAGEALSELGARIGNFTTCSARAEINVIERATGKVLLAERATQRAADLSENLAAKEALAKAGRVLGLAVLEHFAANPAPAPATAPSR
jgi:TolB-like protein